jgi:hypothetical protein
MTEVNARPWPHWQSSFCGHQPVFVRGRCAACHAHGRTLAGELEGARDGVVHATEVEIYFRRCAELASEPIEAVRCRELTIEWAQIAASAAADVLRLERKIASRAYLVEEETAAE